jgi:hypothetical protein
MIGKDLIDFSVEDQGIPLTKQLKNSLLKTHFLSTATVMAQLARCLAFADL